MIKENEEIEFLSLENGLLWPYFKKNKVKALSASRITCFIRNLEFKDIPERILKLAAERGKLFHKIIQEYFEFGKYPVFIDSVLQENKENKKNLSSIEKRVFETIVFLKKSVFLNNSKFIGSENLHYTVYNNELIAAYSDINFNDCIIELKSSSSKSKENPLISLVFEIQLLIQYICTKKDIYLLWSTGEGIIFNKFKKSEKLLKVLDVLILATREEEKKEFSEKEKKRNNKKNTWILFSKQIWILLFLNDKMIKKKKIFF